MKLFFDQNLSPRLVAQVADLAPDSEHIRTFSLDTADDAVVWAYARGQGFDAVVTKDTDFNNIVALLGPPPKVIRIAFGNCTTAQVESTLRAYWPYIEAFIADKEHGLMEITEKK